MSEGFYFYRNGKVYELVDFLNRDLSVGDYFLAAFSYRIHSAKTNSTFNAIPIFKIEKSGMITALTVNGEVIEDAQPIFIAYLNHNYGKYMSHYKCCVYKINLTDDIQMVLNNRLKFNIYTDLRDNELLQRELKPGDLVLYNCKPKYVDFRDDRLSFGIATGSKEIFNGKCVINNVCKYLISQPEGEELEIQKQLILKYNEFMHKKVQEKEAIKNSEGVGKETIGALYKAGKYYYICIDYDKTEGYKYIKLDKRLVSCKSLNCCFIYENSIREIIETILFLNHYVVGKKKLNCVGRLDAVSMNYILAVYERTKNHSINALHITSMHEMFNKLYEEMVKSKVEED